MKTAEEKAAALLEKWRTGGGGSDDECEARVIHQIIQILKEQDRDTRHACAEAVLRCPTVCEDIDTGKAGISPDDAHAACMNVKAA